ncbi:MAG: DUF4179 domain-containing protein [Clostridia bacterium]|nr:DUF4179 domain-containing protein [Clostridia bacterium]
MNRMEEYTALQADLEQSVPALEETLARAKTRLRRRNRRIYKAAGSFFAGFALFVVLVNFCTPVAYACSKVPGLRELAQAVTFSRSLTDAVKNEYVQPISLTQTQNGITASVEYLIVDQKQVNVFYRLTAEGYQTLDSQVDFYQVNGERFASSTSGPNDYDVPIGQLQSATLELLEGEVPGQMQFDIGVYTRDTGYNVPPEPVDVEDGLFRPPHWEPTELAYFTFLLEFDPTFTAKAKVYPVNQTVELEGKQVTIQQVEVYPTHLRVLVEDHPENTAKLQRLFFYIETDWGMKFETESNGTVSFRLGDSNVTTYRADSTYFYKANRLRLVITGAEWLNRDMETTYVNLVTGETGPLPEGVSFVAADKKEDGWLVTFKAKERREAYSHQLFDLAFLDAQGQSHNIWSWSHGIRYPLQKEELENCFGLELPLVDYYEDEVWLKPHYSHLWEAENELVVTIQ